MNHSKERAARPVDPVHYFGIEVEYWQPMGSDESTVTDLKVMAFKPYKLFEQAVICTPKTGLVPDLTDSPMERSLYIRRDFLTVPRLCMQAWGMKSIVLPDIPEYSPREHGIAWLLAFAQLTGGRSYQTLSAYAVTKHGRSPKVYDKTPRISFGPVPSWS
jgi:hypothetical protein